MLLKISDTQFALMVCMGYLSRKDGVGLSFYCLFTLRLYVSWVLHILALFGSSMVLHGEGFLFFLLLGMVAFLELYQARELGCVFGVGIGNRVTVWRLRLSGLYWLRCPFPYWHEVYSLSTHEFKDT